MTKKYIDTGRFFTYIRGKAFIFMAFSLLALLSLGLSACTPSKDGLSGVDGSSDSKTDENLGESFQALLLDNNSALITESDTNLIGKHGLLVLGFQENASGEKPSIGSLHTYQIEPNLLDSWPPQAKVTSFNKIKDEAGSIVISFDTAAGLFNYFAEDKIHLIDVRTVAEFEEEHIKGALNLPLDELEDIVGQAVPNTSDILVIYCRSGNRTKVAAAILEDLGYKVILDAGGILDYEGQLD